MSVRRPPADQRPLTTSEDLRALWRSVLVTEPFRVRCLWLLFLDPRSRPAGPLITVEDLPDGPYDLRHEDLVTLCRGILDGPGADPARQGSVAMLTSRPGGAPWTVSDRAWGRFLLGAAEVVGGRVWPVHQAHHSVLEEFRPPLFSA